MKQLIIHIGPIKCGSTTIQDSLASQAVNSGKFTFTFLDTSLMHRLAALPPERENIRKFESLLVDQFDIKSTVVLSHEVIFQLPSALAQMVKIARDHADHIRIVGYSRRPSSFLRSSYCQWIFRSPSRSKESWEHLVEAGLAPEIFTGLERHFIAAIKTNLHSARQIIGQTIVDWGKTYEQIENLIAPYNAELSVGTLPSDEENFSLIEDFYLRCGLKLDLSAKDNFQRKNLQYDLDLVEAVQIAVIEGMEMPHPNGPNRYFVQFARGLPPAGATKNMLLDDLAACVDGMLWESNQDFANKYGFDPVSMRPLRTVEIKDALLSARREQERRLSDPGGLLREQTRIIARLTKASYEQFRRR